MKIVLLISFLLLSFSTSWAEPLEFRGIKMGVSKTEVLSQKNIRLNDCFSDCCHIYEPIKNIDVKVFYCFTEEKELLDHIIMYFNPDDYPTLKQALIGKYGKTPKIIKRAVQNRMGAGFQGEVAVWNFKSGDSILITKYGNTLEEGVIMFESKEYNQAQKEKEKKDKAAPGF